MPSWEEARTAAVLVLVLCGGTAAVVLAYVDGYREGRKAARREARRRQWVNLDEEVRR